jgi:hypothetical protein
MALACAPLAPHLVRAQSGRKIYRVGVLWLIEPQPWIAKAFMDELQRLGLTEKTNLLIETRTARSLSHLEAVAAELVALQPPVPVYGAPAYYGAPGPIYYRPGHWQRRDRDDDDRDWTHAWSKIA